MAGQWQGSGRAVAGHLAGPYPIEHVLLLARVCKADILEGQHRRWQLVTVWELEVEGAFMLHWWRQSRSLHLVQDLLFTLSLLHQVGVGAYSGGSILSDRRIRMHEVCLASRVRLEGDCRRQADASLLAQTLLLPLIVPFYRLIDRIVTGLCNGKKWVRL